MRLSGSTHAERLARREAVRIFLFVVSALLPAAALAQAPPPEWAVSDVGAAAIPGAATYAAQTYAVSGSGSGVGGTADQFTFFHYRLTGDSTLIARVNTLPLTLPDAQAGVMIRQGLHAGSTHGAVLLSRSGGLTFARRRSAAGATTTTAGGSGMTSAWVRIDRRDAAIIASWSTDGSTWTAIGSDTVSVNDSLYIGLVVASRTLVAPVQVLFTGVQAVSLIDYGGPLPAGWASQDIGGPGQPGAARFDPGTFAIRGGGTDIAGSWDEFHYVYRTADSDIDVVARIRDLGDTNAQSKAGVMVRDSLTPNGTHASMFVTASGTSIFRRRADGGGATTDTAGPPRSGLVWIRLSVRSGVATASWSADGSSWTTVDTEPLTLPSPFYVGLAVTSRDNAATVTTNIDDVSVTIVPPQTSAPVVAVTAPASGATFTAPATITISANATDGDGTISRVDFFRGTNLIGSDSTSPYSVTWSSVPAGTYSLTAIAIDDDGATTMSAARTVTVNAPANQPPTTSLTAPANGATYTAPASITITATAADTDGTIARVHFYQGSTLLGSDTTSPYSFTWNDVPAGTYSLTARATDDDGAATMSAARTVRVHRAAGQRSAVFTPSSDHDTLVNSYLLEIFATGGNPATATPLATQNLGKPAVVNGEVTADVTTTINGLSPGTYQATVSAVGSGGSSRSGAATFTR